MVSRSENRRLAVQAIFTIDFGNRNPVEVLLSMTNGSGDTDKKFARKLIEGVAENLSGIDAIISGASKKWRFSRLGAIERAVLRIAVFELTYTDTPYAVVINEAVDIAREFGEKEAPPLINAILDTVLKNVNSKSQGKTAGSK